MNNAKKIATAKLGTFEYHIFGTNIEFVRTKFGAEVKYLVIFWLYFCFSLLRLA